MYKQIKFAATLVPLAAALLFNAARADANDGSAFAEEAPATLSFSTDVNDPAAPQVQARGSFIDPNSQATVANQVVAGFDTRGFDSTGDDLPVTRFARSDSGNDLTAGTR
jgi:hypothetical protein